MPQGQDKSTDISHLPAFDASALPAYPQSPAQAIASGASPETIQSATQREAKGQINKPMYYVPRIGDENFAQKHGMATAAQMENAADAAPIPTTDALADIPYVSNKLHLPKGVPTTPFTPVAEDAAWMLPLGGGKSAIGRTLAGAGLGAGTRAVTRGFEGRMPSLSELGNAAIVGGGIGLLTPLLEPIASKIPALRKYLPEIEEKTEATPAPQRLSAESVNRMRGHGSYDPVSDARASVSKAMKRPATMAPLRPTPISEQAVGSVEKEAGYQPPVIHVPFRGGAEPNVTYEQVPGPDTAGKGNLLTPAARRGEAGAGNELVRRGRTVIHEGQPDVGVKREVIKPQNWSSRGGQSGHIRIGSEPEAPSPLGLNGKVTREGVQHAIDELPPETPAEAKARRYQSAVIRHEQKFNGMRIPEPEDLDFRKNKGPR